MFSVFEVTADPYRWARSLEALAAEGLPVTEFPQSPQRMSPATSGFHDAVMGGTLTHDGDPRLARHISNCVLKADTRGSRIVKDAKSSARKIDLAVCAVMAFERARAGRDDGPSDYESKELLVL
jgi:phage terminase large subunit-like protein